MSTMQWYQNEDGQWVCTWTLTCQREAAGVVAHPILQFVPTCQHHADMLGLDLLGWDLIEVEATPA